MQHRIIGFDLARAYAILGMFIVNFNTVFGSHTNHKGLSGFLNLFNGNSSTLFVILAGMGVSLMTNRNDYTPDMRREKRGIILRRSWFLFFLGVAFYAWWPADILHFYGGYMHIAALMVFLPKRYFLGGAGLAILVFHVLLFLIPYDRGWNFDTLMYADFWTPAGFIRNTFYNGWNPIFPWLAYFLLGMYLGRLDWQQRSTIKRVLISGLVLYLLVFTVQTFASSMTSDKDLRFYLTADYLPPFLPFMLGTSGFGMVLIGLFMFVGKHIGNTRLAGILAATGQMTLTHYLGHLTLGLILLSLLTGRTLDYDMLQEPPSDPLLILGFAIAYFIGSCVFSLVWTKKFRHGPMELLMRRVSDGKTGNLR